MAAGAVATPHATAHLSAMCLLIVSSNGFAELGDALLAAALRHNPHGAGLMWHDGARLRTLRQRHIGAPGVRSRGLANVHPHVLGDGATRLCLMHNGDLEAWQGCPQRSDTARFAHEWLAPAWQVEPDITSLAFRMRLRAAVPAGNRLALADHLGRWCVLGEDEGWWCGETWLSNPKARAW